MTQGVLPRVAFFLFAVGLAVPFDPSLAQVPANNSGATPRLPSMDPNANPSFEVATIKPNDSGKPSMQGLTIIGDRFKTVNASLNDLIQVAYEVQARQIVNGPEWMAKSRYDIIAVTDEKGVPNAEQVRLMMRKLLADRFKLKLHHYQRELSAYVLTVGKQGANLKATGQNGQLPNFHYRTADVGLTLFGTNATMTDFTGYLQLVVLDRPVVNRTGITGRFDFQCTFTPDDSQFNGRPPLPANTSSAPSLYEALQQQLGLKLNAERTSIDVIAIDHIEPPSVN
jgi:uncharacterized protein (TIGR03435 family)